MPKIIVFTIITLIRIIGVGAFLFIHPFWAYLINALLDMADGPIYKHFIKVDTKKAQLQDKVLDLWLYTTAIFTIFNTYPGLASGSPRAGHLSFSAKGGWASGPTYFLLFLYLYRLAGQIVFFITKNKRLLVYFPNFFENFFFFFTFLDLISANYLLEKPLFMYPSVILLITGKIAHEVSLHCRNETVFDNIILPFFRQQKR